MNSTVGRKSESLRGRVAPRRLDVAQRYLVTGRGFAESVHPTIELAVARARALGSGALVVCVERSQEFETRHTVWPAVGPVHAGHL